MSDAFPIQNGLK